MNLIPVAQAEETIRREMLEGVARHFESSIVVTTSGAWDVETLDGLIAVDGARVVGSISWRSESLEVEIVSLFADPPRSGVGSRLLDGAIVSARRRGANRIWLVTTNDNIDALRFYQRRGFRLARVHCGSIDEARKIKPSIPIRGAYDIEIHDDVELAMTL